MNTEREGILNILPSVYGYTANTIDDLLILYCIQKEGQPG
jgi:hypothetical protein